MAGTFNEIERLVLDAADELLVRGVGSHVHFDAVLGEYAPTKGSAAWLDIAFAGAITTQRSRGRFRVVVPLGWWESVPSTADAVAALTSSSVDSFEPPSLLCLPDTEGQRTWRGELYRLDLDEREGVLIWLEVSRAALDADAGDPYRATLNFERIP